MSVKSNLCERLAILFILILRVTSVLMEESNEIIEIEDELFKLFNISFIKEITSNYEHLKVTLKEMPLKGGIGIFANKPIKTNRTILYYKILIHNETTYSSPTNRSYCFSVYDKDEEKVPGLVGDIFEESNQKPRGRKPFWGYLVNEPNGNQTQNVYVDMNIKENYRYKDNVSVGDILIYKFVTIQDIDPGEEITWCYGKNYKRNYETSCNYKIKDAKTELSNLFNITYIKDNTRHYENLSVALKEVPHKHGIGVFATEFIEKDQAILYCKMKVYNIKTYNSYSNGLYQFHIRSKNHTVIMQDIIADIYEGSNPDPKDNIPFWGYLLNESDESQTQNVRFDPNTNENYKEKDTIEPDDIIVYTVISIRDIRPGEEITWKANYI